MENPLKTVKAGQRAEIIEANKIFNQLFNFSRGDNYAGTIMHTGNLRYVPYELRSDFSLFTQHPLFTSRPYV